MKFHHERALALSQQPHARMIDTTVGYKLLEVSRVIFLPMLFYGGYLTCRTDLYQYPAIAKEAFYDFMSLTISDKAIFVYVLVVCTTISTWWATRANPVYCIDFVTYKGPKHLQVTRKRFSEVTGSVANQTEESKRFQMRVYDAGRIGEETTFPESIMAKQPKLNMEGARQEAKDVMCSSVSELFQRTGISPKKIDIVIVNCSLFCPTPSLTAMLVQHFQMRSDILSYNLGGMGCSAGVISIDLAKRLLQNLPKGSHALVVSTENITQNWYHGNQKSMLLSNCLFRQGAAAILLCNGGKTARHAKLQLHQSIRTHRGATEEAYQCVYQTEDEHGYRGVRLSREVMRIAGEALTQNIVNLGPLVLPWTEQLRFFLNQLARKALKNDGVTKKVLCAILDAPVIGGVVKYIVKHAERSDTNGGEYTIDPYVPDFQRAFDHFCVHAGGRAVIDAIEKSLQLDSEKMEPSRQTLYRFGNVSSASIWYEMEWILKEAKDVKAGQSVWQIAFGSGFKCNSAVWKILPGYKNVKVYVGK